MRRISVAETETLLATIQKRSGLDKRSYNRVRRSIESKIKTSKSISEASKKAEKRKIDIFQIDPENTIEMHLFDVTFNKSEKERAFIDEAFRQYNEKLGYWVTISDKGMLKHVLSNADRSYTVNKKGMKKKHGKVSYAKSALEYASIKLYVEDDLEKTHLRAFKNGTVDLRSGALFSHSHTNYLTNCIPHDYTPGSECPDVMRRYIETSYGPDFVPIIRAAISMCLDPTAPDKFIHCIGESGSGKGVISKLIRKMFGTRNSRVESSFSLLHSPDKRHQILQGCGLFIVDDITGYVGDEIGSFYTLVERTPMTCRSLFNSSTYSKSFNTRFIVCSTKQIPIKSGTSRGWNRRVLPLVTQPVTNKDLELEVELEKCIAEIISWALSMPRKGRDAIIQNPGDYHERIAQYLDEADLSSNSVKSFVDSCLAPMEDIENRYISNSERNTHPSVLFSWYKAYCLSTNLRPMGMNHFLSALKAVLPFHHIDKRRAVIGDTEFVPGERRKVPAKWVYLEPVHPTLFESNEGYEESYMESSSKVNFNSAKMTEGQLAAFAGWAQKYKPFYPFHESQLRQLSENGPGRPEKFRDHIQTTTQQGVERSEAQNGEKVPGPQLSQSQQEFQESGPVVPKVPDGFSGSKSSGVCVDDTYDV